MGRRLANLGYGKESMRATLGHSSISAKSRRVYKRKPLAAACVHSACVGGEAVEA